MTKPCIRSEHDTKRIKKQFEYELENYCGVFAKGLEHSTLSTSRGGGEPARCLGMACWEDLFTPQTSPVLEEFESK